MGLRKSSPAAGEFLFEIDPEHPEPLNEQVTAPGGNPAFCTSGAFPGRGWECGAAPTIEATRAWFDEATYVESLLALNAVEEIA